MELRSNGMAMPPSTRVTDQPQATAPQATRPASSQNPAGVEGVQAVQPTEAGKSAAGLDEALRSINDSMRSMAQSIEFTIDPDTDRTVVKVVDQDTKEVIRQMPSVEALEIAKALDRLQGLLIRQQA